MFSPNKNRRAPSEVPKSATRKRASFQQMLLFTLVTSGLTSSTWAAQCTGSTAIQLASGFETDIDTNTRFTNTKSLANSGTGFGILVCPGALYVKDSGTINNAGTLAALAPPTSFPESYLQNTTEMLVTNSIFGGLDVWSLATLGTGLGWSHKIGQLSNGKLDYELNLVAPPAPAPAVNFLILSGLGLLGWISRRIKMVGC